MKLAVVGSREGIPKHRVVEEIEIIHNKFKHNDRSIVIVSSHAPGVDMFAEEWADSLGVDKLIFPAEWKKYGKKAGKLRNPKIINTCDAALIFWDGKSPGTKHSFGLAVAAEIPIKLFVIPNPSPFHKKLKV